MHEATFATTGGIRVPAVDSDGMRDVDRIAVETWGLSILQMMENAGRSLARLVMGRLGDEIHAAPVVVLSGRGGNGGGGICAARHLANHGVDVTVVVGDPDRLEGAPAAQLHTFRGTGGSSTTARALGGLDPALVVDAVLGYGLAGAPRGAPAEMVAWMAGSHAPVVSLDVPSGVDATTGATPGPHVRADETLTLALPKTGLRPDTAGAVSLADIGIPIEVYRSMGLAVSPDTFGGRHVVRLVPADRGQSTAG